MPYLALDDDVRELTPETTVGSGAQATWRIANKDLAGRHFTIRFRDGSATVIPASPQNVVVVNGRQVPPSGAPIQVGDLITAGNARFALLAERDAERPTTPAQPNEAYLVDPSTRQAYHLRKRTVTIGRDAASSVVLRDPSVSRHHADIRAEADGFVLYSSGATGTSLNGTDIKTPRLLADGDQIQLGGTALAFATTLPSGLRVVEPTVAREDALTTRETMLDQSAIPSTGVRAYSQRRPIPLWTVVLAVVVILLLLWYFLMR
jgi:pSer/pThr/pTyr-binding forkhead associated (FHA) protein